MQGQPVTQVAVNLGSLVKALYHQLPVTEENTKAVRATAWAALGNVMVSDYLNCWNEASAGGAAARDLLDNAEMAVGEALKLNGTLALAHYAQGLVHRARNRRQAALDSFSNAIKNDPGFARAWAQRGSEKINDGDFDGALDDLRHAIEIGRDDPSAGMFYWNRGRAYFFKNDDDEAIMSLRRAVELRPNLWHNWLYLVSAYARKEGPPYSTAKDWLNRFETQSPFAGQGFTIAKVISYEGANPTNNAAVKAGRDEFHKGLEWAGMKQN
jgi:tetratricopeptide (TPR) repeat protein